MGHQVHDLLLAEDSGDDVDLLLRAVERYDATLKTYVARDGQEALDVLLSASQPPRLVLLDLHLPKLSGIEVLQRVRSSEIICPPIVLFSGSGSRADTLDAYRCGVNSWVHKPTKYDEIQAVVSGILSYWLTVNTVPARYRDKTFPLGTST